MSERIDVLAVMDADGRAVACVIDDCVSLRREEEWRAHLVQHDLARDAVAELVDDLRLLAAGESRDEHGRIWTGFDTDDVIAFARRALARIAPNELHNKAAELRGRGE